MTRGEVWWITGASSGIGAEVARQVGERGGTVLLTARRREALEEVAAAVEAAGGQAHILPADVTDDEGLRRALEAGLEATDGQLDVVFACAGYGLVRTVEEVAPEAFLRQLDVNLVGVHRTVQAALPHLRPGGRILVLASLAAYISPPRWAAYAASKAGLRGYCDALREELAPRGIRVVAIHPGAIETPFFDAARHASGTEVRPVGPVLKVDRVARAVLGAARRPRREVFVPAYARAYPFLTALLPGLVYRVIRWMMR